MKGRFMGGIMYYIGVSTVVVIVSRDEMKKHRQSPHPSRPLPRRVAMTTNRRGLAWLIRRFVELIRRPNTH